MANSSKKEWSVYVVRCADGTLYTGVAKNVSSRVAAHNAGQASKYTRCRLPVEVVHIETVLERGAALRRELEIKKLDKAGKEELVK